jgi:multimeric flavodoxin WrbA
MALEVALRGARETGAEATLVDLRDYQLNFCDGKENESGIPKTFSGCEKRLNALRDSFSARRSITAG